VEEYVGEEEPKKIKETIDRKQDCYKLHSACISTTSRPIFTN